MDMQLTDIWLNAGDNVPPADKIIPSPKRELLSHVFGTALTDGNWETLDAWQKRVEAASLHFGTVVRAIIHGVRENPLAHMLEPDRNVFADKASEALDALQNVNLDIAAEGKITEKIANLLGYAMHQPSLHYRRGNESRQTASLPVFEAHVSEHKFLLRKNTSSSPEKRERLLMQLDVLQETAYTVRTLIGILMEEQKNDGGNIAAHWAKNSLTVN